MDVWNSSIVNKSPKQTLSNFHNFGTTEMLVIILSVRHTLWWMLTVALGVSFCCSGLTEDVLVRVVASISKRPAALLASRLGIWTYRAVRKRRKPRNPPGTTPGGRGPWNVLRRVRRFFYWLNSVNPARVNLSHHSHSLSPPTFPPVLFFNSFACRCSSCWYIDFLAFSLTPLLVSQAFCPPHPESCCSPFCPHYKPFNAHLSVRASQPGTNVWA